MLCTSKTSRRYFDLVIYDFIHYYKPNFSPTLLKKFPFLDPVAFGMKNLCSDTCWWHTVRLYFVLTLFELFKHRYGCPKLWRNLQGEDRRKSYRRGLFIIVLLVFMLPLMKDRDLFAFRVILSMWLDQPRSFKISSDICCCRDGRLLYKLYLF